MARYIDPAKHVDAIQLKYDIMVNYPNGEYSDGGVQGYLAGTWVVSHPQGGQSFMSDRDFKAKYKSEFASNDHLMQGYNG